MIKKIIFFFVCSLTLLGLTACSDTEVKNAVIEKVNSELVKHFSEVPEEKLYKCVKVELYESLDGSNFKEWSAIAYLENGFEIPCEVVEAADRIEVGVGFQEALDNVGQN